MVDVRLVDVDAQNWREVSAIAPRPDQQRWVESTPYYLALCHYGGVWRPLAALVDDQVVGFAMWGYDEDEASYWIGGVVLAPERQGQGVGRSLMTALMQRLATLPDCHELALSIAEDNTVARGLYRSLGFVETDERVDDELVARLRLD
ncbi:MAG: GNAT family N-acetyltransferase [Actinomycetes bacterium]